MIYQLLKIYTRLVFRLYFRKLYFHGAEKIPTDRSVLFAVNHPTAFLDPIFVAAHIKPSTYFLLRGDVFQGPVVKWFLNQIKTIPIFRFRNGFSSLRNNQATFDYCHDLMGRGNNILILAEGQTRHEKKLRPIQKGTARLLLGAYEKHPDGKYCILPIGVNYTAANELRSEMMNAVGKPILLEDYLDAYKENPRKAVKQITDEITRQLRQSVVHVNEDKDEPFVNRLLTYRRNERNKTLLPYRSESLQPITEEVEIANTINQMTLEEKENISQQVTEYDALLEKYQIDDFAVAQPDFASPLSYVILLLGFPFWLIGYGLFYKIPFGLGKIVADSKVKLPAFYGSVVFAVGLVFYMLMTLVFLITALVSWSLKPLVVLALIFILIYLGVHYKDYLELVRKSWRWGSLDKDVQSELLKRRKKTIAQV
ncbi:MAG: 1-acyl-sn-glycerol-3-phosphate acyltransferase [Saprospiraceae bacterium]